MDRVVRLKLSRVLVGTEDRFEDLVERGACGLKLWKDLGTNLSDADGKLLRVDDERLSPLFEKAAELGVPITLHTSYPDAFFLPIDPEKERYEELGYLRPVG
jgi:hypothetical protein